MKIGLAGDWHGDARSAKHVIKALSEHTDVLLHAGDFGIWPGTEGRHFTGEINKALNQAGIRMLVTPGNHEDWDQIDRHALEDRHGLGPIAWFRSHIGVLPRGHRFELGGRSFVSLGGGPSLDFEHRTEGETWWPREAVTDEDVARTVAGGHADVMLTHDSPGAPWATPKVQSIIYGGNPFGWSLRALAYAAEGRAKMDAAFEGVRPSLLVHGHMHTVDEHVVTANGFTCRVVSLHMSGHGGNYALLDTDTLEVEWFDVRKDPDQGWVRA